MPSVLDALVETVIGQREPLTASRRLKVMMLTVGLEVGGTENQALELSSRLDRRRFYVTVCALKGEGAIASELRDRGIKVVALSGKGKWDVRVPFRLWRVLRAERPDIIHAFLFLSNIISRVMGRCLNVPVVMGSYRGVEIWKSWPFVFIDRMTSGWTQTMTCCSHAVRQSVLSRIGGSPEKYVAIHNGVDVARFGGRSLLTRADLGLPDHVGVIGTVCRLNEPLKGLANLLQAFARLLTEPGMDHCRLLLVGDGPSRSRLEDLAMTLGISKYVVFAGMRRDVEQILPLIDLFVLPSLYEGFGIAIIEAMAASRPVVATAVGGIPEIVVQGETGLLVPPGDVAGLAGAMCRILSHPERAAAYGAAGLRRVCERFSIEIAVKRHEDLYETLFATSGRASRRQAKTGADHGQMVVPQ